MRQLAETAKEVEHLDDQLLDEIFFGEQWWTHLRFHRSILPIEPDLGNREEYPLNKYALSQDLGTF